MFFPPTIFFNIFQIKTQADLFYLRFTPLFYHEVGIRFSEMYLVLLFVKQPKLFMGNIFVHQGCIYLIKNSVKTVILWNIIPI